VNHDPDALRAADRRHLERCLALARDGLEAGSGPIGAVILNRDGEVISEGRNHAAEPWPPEPRRIAESSFAHAEMDAFYRVGKYDDWEGCTIYTSLEPCLMCGGAIGMVRLARVVWACDDPWGGSGRLIRWNEHPAFERTEVAQHPFPDLEREASLLFAPEAHRVYPPEGWARWRERYPDACERVERMLREVPERTRDTHGPPPVRPDPDPVG
jgi:tRNA(adenine34) deaminase